MTIQDKFDAPIAYNPTGGDEGEGVLVPSSEFQVFAVDDVSFTTPLAVTDPSSGVSLDPLRSSSIGVLPDFRVAGDPSEVVLKSGSFVTVLMSRFGIFTEAGWDPVLAADAVAAAGVAEAARDAAVAAQEAAEAVPLSNDAIVESLIQDPDSATAAALNATIAGIAAVPNVEASGAYPPRPDAPVVAWIGTVDPDAFMEANDFWVDLAAPAPLSLSDVENELLTPGSDLALAASEAVGTSRDIWVGAPDFATASGPTLGAGASNSTNGVPVWNMDKDANEAIHASIIIPPGWHTAKTQIWWTHNTGSPTGNVRWRFTSNMLVVGGLISDSNETQSDNNVAVPDAADKIAVHEPSATNSLDVTAGGILRMTVERQATNAGDTFDADAQVIGVRLVRLT